MNVLHTSSSSHEDTFQLLPWYINGTLEADEQAHVEEHINECPICQQEIKLLTSVERTIVNDQVSDLANNQQRHTLNPQAGFDALMQRIEQSESSTTSKSAFIGKLKNYFAGFSLHPFNRYGWSTALPVVALVLITTILAWPQMSSHEPVYKTLSGQNPPAQDSLRLRVIFTDISTDKEAQEFLDQLDKRIVIKRLQDASYMLEVPPDTEPGSITALLHTLKSSDKVVTAELVLE